MYKLVAIDLDGTMLNSYGIVTQNTKNIIKENIKKGTKIIIASGRTISSIKPIAVISPAIQEKVITAATVYDDVQTQFDGNYKPKDDGNKYRGLINIRDIIAYSQNVPEVKIMKELTPGKSIERF